MKSVLFLLAGSVGALAYESEGNVLKLGADDFDIARKEHPNMLVKFFAPWYSINLNKVWSLQDTSSYL